MSIVENIKWLCKQKDLSIPKIEKALKYGNGAIYNWDKNSPTIGKLQQVADYLGSTTDFLIYGFDEEIVETIKSLAKIEKDKLYFTPEIKAFLNAELSGIRKEFYDVPFDLDPIDMITLISETALSNEFKEELLQALNKVKQKVNPTLSPKDEKDIAKRLAALENDLASQETLMLSGEILDEETRELLKSALEHAVKVSKLRAKKKFSPKKKG